MCVEKEPFQQFNVKVRVRGEQEGEHRVEREGNTIQKGNRRRDFLMVQNSSCFDCGA